MHRNLSFTSLTHLSTHFENKKHWRTIILTIRKLSNRVHPSLKDNFLNYKKSFTVLLMFSFVEGDIFGKPLVFKFWKPGIFGIKISYHYVPTVQNQNWFCVSKSRREYDFLCFFLLTLKKNHNFGKKFSRLCSLPNLNFNICYVRESFKNWEFIEHMYVFLYFDYKISI